MTHFEPPVSPEKDRAEEVDWTEFKARAAELRQAGEARQCLSKAERQDIFAQRAARLSVQKEERDEGAESLQVISFDLVGRSFGVDVHYLKEVYDAEHITAIPCTPSVFVGLLNYRGEVLTVLDLACLLGLESQNDLLKPARYSPQGQRVLIVKNANLMAGILVGHLHKMLSVPLDSIQPLSSFFAQKNKLIRSQSLIEGRLLLLIDPKALLSDTRLSHSEVL